MQLPEAIREIQKCGGQMDACYGRVVFDEFAIMSFFKGTAFLVHYAGPRPAGFLQNFSKDVTELRAGLASQNYAVGDFEFARHGVGTGFESFMMLGAGLYLICNNTSASMDMIAKDPKWLGAQVPFASLGDLFRANPLVL